jgi:hypothetical protein
MTRPSSPSPTATSITRPVRSTSSPRVQMPVIAEQHDTDLVRIDVERDAEHAARKLQQLFIAHTGKSGHFGDAGGDV